MENKVTLNIDGKIIEYQILKLLCPSNSDINYLIYTDGINNYASRCNIINDLLSLEPIKHRYEWDYIRSNYYE